MDKIKHSFKRVIVETVGWLLVIVGLAAIVLPGPGLLILFLGLSLLATQYNWAEKRVAPVKKAAFRASRQAVESKLNVVVSVITVLIIAGVGVVWVIHPAVPSWWPVPDHFWLFGGKAAGYTIIASAVLVTGMIACSWYEFRTKDKH